MLDVKPQVVKLLGQEFPHLLLSNADVSYRNNEEFPVEKFNEEAARLIESSI
jgi:hypothetical protein